MPNSITQTIVILLALGCLISLSISGYSFLTNQYVYFRYCEQANVSTSEFNVSPFDQSTSEDDSSPHDQAQSDTAKTLALFSLISIGCSIFAVIPVGRLSDRYGRRLAIGVVLLGQGLSNIVVTFVILLHLPVHILLVDSLARGLIGGGFISFLVQMNVCFADLTRVTLAKDAMSSESDRLASERRRLILLGLFDAVVMICAAVAATVCGAMINRYGFIVPALTFLAVYGAPVWLLWLLPETYHPSPPVPLTIGVEDETNLSVEIPSDTISSVIVVPSIWNVLRSHGRTTLILLCVGFIYSIVVLSENQFLFLYLMAEPFVWTPGNVGIYNGTAGVLLAVSSLSLALLTALGRCGGLRNPVPSTTDYSDTTHLIASSSNHNHPHPSFSLSEDQSAGRHILLSWRLRILWYLVVGFVVTSCNRFLMAFAYKLSAPNCNIVVYLALILLAVRSAIVPTLKSYLSSIHSSETQGQIFSMFGMTEYFGLLVGLPGMSSIYAVTISMFPGTVFILSACLSLVAVLLIIVVLWPVIKERRDLTRIDLAVI